MTPPLSAPSKALVNNRGLVRAEGRRLYALHACVVWKPPPRAHLQSASWVLSYQKNDLEGPEMQTRTERKQQLPAHSHTRSGHTCLAEAYDHTYYSVNRDNT